VNLPDKDKVLNAVEAAAYAAADQKITAEELRDLLAALFIDGAVYGSKLALNIMRESAPS
jgi:hypothetical protein